MCQATAFLDGKEIMKDVVTVEPGPEGVLLSQFFEEPILISAEIRKIDLIKHQVILESKDVDQTIPGEVEL
jgi:predicted RNA-binding protein